jgi:hypothetical protein
VRETDALSGGTIRPTPQKNAAPFARQGPHGRWVGLPRVTLRLIRDPRPEGMPERCSCPLHERLASELGTLQTPGHPGCLAAPVRARRKARVFWECSGRRVAFPRCADGDEEAGAQTAPAPGKAANQGKAGWPWACGARAVSKSAIGYKVTRSGATRACTRRAWGVRTPSSVVKALALLRAWRRVAMRSAERP